MEDVRVKDAMTWVVVTTHPEATVSHAALVMFERRVGCLPVVRDERLVGILTEHDLLKALAKEFPTMHFAAEGFLW
jgi:acetoin utilization protein AcuB